MAAPCSASPHPAPLVRTPSPGWAHRATTLRAVLALALWLSGGAAWSETGEAAGALAFPKQAGSPLGLEEAIRLGLDHHPALDRGRARTRFAEAVTKQTKGQRYPWLEASVAGSMGSLRIITADGKNAHTIGGHGFDPGGALPKTNQNMITGGLLLNQLITDFGQTSSRILASQSGERAAEMRLLGDKALIILDIQRAFFTCLLRQELIEVAARTLAQRQTVLNGVQDLYRNKLKSKVDVDLIQVEVANARLALIKARNDLTQAFADLNHAMGLSGATAYELEPVSVEVAAGAPIDALLQESLAHRPELLEGRAKVQISDELLKAARALRFGEFSAVGSIGATQYGEVHDGGIPPDGYAPFWGVGGAIRVPIFAGFRIEEGIREAGHRKGASQHEVEQIGNEVILQVVRAYLSQTTNAEQIGLERERLRYAQEAFLLVQERYRLGLSSIVEVVQSMVALFVAESRLVEAQYVYKISQAAVAYAAGQDYRRF